MKFKIRNSLKMTLSHPLKINVGSGKGFKPDCINIDINTEWNPDIVTDLGIPLFSKPNKPFQTDRFGLVKLTENTFAEMYAFDVLEHIPDLVTFMKNCLDLLAINGTFEIIAPYDLSYGAWQDPTHLHAFNERSWLYYTDWFWYLSWDTARFMIDTLQYLLNDYGNTLINKGLSIDEVARMPRAVDSMRVVLKKVILSIEEKEVLKTHQERKGKRLKG